LDYGFRDEIGEKMEARAAPFRSHKKPLEMSTVGALARAFLPYEEERFFLGVFHMFH
jgi:hypothetical protein